ncbi:hypothetical protein Tco_0876298 [Tanacetum coccineum]|uniref:Uncharacterized protein n=1 Tax=Tanacetum coccineum TaxID=301880 RepID=A0ABQ5BUU7_9ASTR
MRMVNEDFQFTPLNSNLQLSCLSPIGTSEGYEKILGDDGFLAKTYVLTRSSVVLSRTFSVGDIVLLYGWDLAVDGASVTSFSMLFSIPTTNSVKLIGFNKNDAPIVKVDELRDRSLYSFTL